jgi:hypothetical protein
MEVRTPQDIASAVATLWRDQAALDLMRAGADMAMEQLGGALEKTAAALEPFLVKSDMAHGGPAKDAGHDIPQRVSRAT